jgi:translation elongation factor EF-Tu-like GTPase
VPSESKPLEMTTLVREMQEHPSIKKLTNDKIEMLRKYMDEYQKGRNIKQLRNLSKNFIERCPPSLMEILTDKTYR